MELISNAELVEIFLLSQENADAQFQYWLSVSFAAIVASSAAGSRINTNIRHLLAALYLLAACVFVIKFLGAQSAIGMYYEEMTVRGLNNTNNLLPPIATNLMIWFRRILFLGGSITTVWFLYNKHTLLNAEGDKDGPADT